MEALERDLGFESLGERVVAGGGETEEKEGKKEGRSRGGRRQKPPTYSLTLQWCKVSAATLHVGSQTLPV